MTQIFYPFKVPQFSQIPTDFFFYFFTFKSHADCADDADFLPFKSPTDFADDADFLPFKSPTDFTDSHRFFLLLFYLIKVTQIAQMTQIFYL